jgi:hexosaminidase
MRTAAALLLLEMLVISGTAAARDQSPAAPVDNAVAVIPQPVKVDVRQGAFTLTAATAIVTDAAAHPIGRQLARYLEPATGFTLEVRTGDAPARGSIVLRIDPALERLGPEGYALDVEPARIVARAPGPAGLFYAVQTIRQLLPPQIFREAPVGEIAWTVPAVSIEDYPRFGWRGALLDVGRHFLPKEFVKKYIDLLALHKLNTFQLHLTDDQGWRLEIARYPKLTQVGAWRKETLAGRYRSDQPEAERRYDGVPHGGFYTQEDAREIVAYAAARFVTVVPEIEMPGHAVAAIAAYPELGITGKPVEVARRWGVFSEIFNAEPSTIQFLQNVLTEVLAIFPSRYIHIGGDEANKDMWKASPRIQARIKELGVGDEHGLQSWFVRQMDAFLTARNRRLVGWDEILEGGLAENAVVMSWRGTEGGIAAARAGHDVIMTPTSHTYLDYYQSKDRAAEPIALGGFLPLETVYAFEPVPEALEPKFARHVLGAQGQLWTEYIPNARKAEYMAFPRLTALSEVVWTPPARKDYASFLERLTPHLSRLGALDVNFRPVDRSGGTPGR